MKTFYELKYGYLLECPYVLRERTAQLTHALVCAARLLVEALHVVVVHLHLKGFVEQPLVLNETLDARSYFALCWKLFKIVFLSKGKDSSLMKLTGFITPTTASPSTKR